MKQIFYSIRVVEATSKNKATERVEAGFFNETHRLCDKVLNEQELIRALTGKAEPTNWVVEIPNNKQNKYTSTLDGMLAANHVKGKLLICIYDR